MKLIKMKCDNCGADLEVNSELDKIHCNFCGAEVLIDDEAANLRRVEEVKLQSRQKNHEQELKERQDKLEQELKEKEIREKANAKEKFKKSKTSKLLIIMAIIALLITFAPNDCSILVKGLALIEAIICIGAWLMGREIIKEPIKGARVIATIIGLVLIIPIGMIQNQSSNNYRSKEYKTIKWDYIILKDHLPKPQAEKGDINSNSDNYLSIDLSIDSEDEYREYIEACKKYGYTNNMNNNTSSFSATNEDGYELNLYYYERHNELTIHLGKRDYSNYLPKEKTEEKIQEEPTPITEEKEEEKKESDNELRKDFKEAMDSYESFMNEYVNFMKKYNSNPSDTSLLKDYSNYMSKYSDFTEKFNKWNSENLNTAETKYYLEVQTRVNKKLLEI